MRMAKCRREGTEAEARWSELVSMATVQLKNVKKIYPFISGEGKKKKNKKDQPEEKKVNLQITDQGVVAVQEFNLDIADKEFIVLVGPSGCGKSTILRLVAGLIGPTTGKITVDGKEITGPSPDRGMVFQKPTLFPWLTVEKNIAFSLKMQSISLLRLRENVPCRQRLCGKNILLCVPQRVASHRRHIASIMCRTQSVLLWLLQATVRMQCLWCMWEAALTLFLRLWQSSLNILLETVLSEGFVNDVHCYDGCLETVYL